MTRDQLADVVASVTGRLGDAPLDQAMEDRLNEAFPVGGETFEALSAACRDGIAAGWMCAQGEGRRKFGRVLEPGPATHGFSVDVVDIDDLAGPHHRHPNGEICMIMPVDARATFDGRGAGWAVYRPGSAHRPTVAGGRAVVLYMLPGGLIEFTKS